MKVQLGVLLSFLTITAVLAQISFAFPDPDRHERNRCRPPSCTPQRPPGKKISEKDEVPIEGNSLDQSSTTESNRNVTDGNETKFENLKADNATEKSEPISSTTPEKVEVVSQNIVSTTAPSADVSVNVTEKSEASPSPTTEKLNVVSQTIISSTVPSAESANVTEGNSTESGSDPILIPSETGVPTETMEDSMEIRIPVEVKIIPPSRDELGGLTGHCPKTFRYHNESGMCFIPGEGKEHPCGALMQFNEEPGSSIYGQCDCKEYHGCDYRPLLYHSEEKKCFHLFQQGPCKSDEWLIPGEKSYEATCSNRTCPANDDKEHGKTWFTLNGTCHQLSTTAFCKNPLETAQYELGKLVPTCSLVPIGVVSVACLRPKTITLGAVFLPCGPGKTSTGSGSCGDVVGF